MFIKQIEQVRFSCRCTTDWLLLVSLNKYLHCPTDKAYAGEYILRQWWTRPKETKSNSTAGAEQVKSDLQKQFIWFNLHFRKMKLKCRILKDILHHCPNFHRFWDINSRHFFTLKLNVVQGDWGQLLEKCHSMVNIEIYKPYILFFFALALTISETLTFQFFNF